MTSPADMNLAANPGKPAPTEKAEPLQLVGFIAGGKAYTLPIVVVQEINRPMPIEPNADGPAWIEGHVSLRGRPVAVVDLGKHLNGTSRGDGAEARVIFIELPANLPTALVGLAVDKVSRVLRLDPAAVKPAGAEATHRAIRGVGTLGEESLQLIAVDQLFTADQLAELQAATKSERGGLAA